VVVYCFQICFGMNSASLSPTKCWNLLAVKHNVERVSRFSIFFCLGFGGLSELCVLTLEFEFANLPLLCCIFLHMHWRNTKKGLIIVPTSVNL